MDGEQLNAEEKARDRAASREDFTLFARLHEIAGGHFRVLQRIHASARGDVYRGQETESGNPIAVRVFVTDPENAPELLKRVAEQVAIARSVGHPAVSVPSEPESAGGVVAYREELAPRSVEDILRERTVVGTKEIYRLVDRVAEVLDHAHARGIVHGRVKPGNLLLDSRGEVTVADFGVHTADSGPTRPRGPSSRTASAYDAPEQWRGHRPGYRSDQYSLAVIAYELLTGIRRIDAPTVEGIQTLEPLEVDSFVPLRPGLGLHVNAALRTALGASPENRFATVRDFADALAGRGPRTSTGLPTSRAKIRLVRRHHLAGVGGAILGVAIAVLAIDPNARSTATGAGRAIRRALGRAPSLESPAEGLAADGSTGRAMGGGSGRGGTSGGFAPGGGTTGGGTAGGGGAPGTTAAGKSTAPSGGSAIALSPTGTSGDGPSGGSRTTTTGSAAGRRVGGGAAGSAVGGAALGSGSQIPGYAAASSVGSRVMSWVRGGKESTPALAPGYISVSASGGGSAVVLVDGVPRGAAPTTVSVLPGRHSVSLRGFGTSFTPSEAVVSVRGADTVGASFQKIEKGNP
ncbi:MAG TPA: serine/threonine-protein kinase [Gemmatimonadaceae bacterium]|nr:serine/threonine-protein kinase [Gemmatimonadaceae bacterium]